MKHEEKRLETKRKLAASLKTLMQRKAFNKITVQDIIRECGVTRKTFYYYFADIYDLLHWMLDQEAIEIVRRFDLMNDYEEAILFVMDYVEENEDIFSSAYMSIGLEELKRFFFADFIGIGRRVVTELEEEMDCRLDDGFRDYLIFFFTEAISGALSDWIRNKKGRNREEVLDFLSFILTEALTHIIEKRSQGEP